MFSDLIRLTARNVKSSTFHRLLIGGKTTTMALDQPIDTQVNGQGQIY